MKIEVGGGTLIQPGWVNLDPTIGAEIRPLGQACNIANYERTSANFLIFSAKCESVLDLI